MLSAKVSLVNARLEPSAKRPPPLVVAVLPEMVEAVRISFELWKYKAPPLGAVFPVSVLRSISHEAWA